MVSLIESINSLLLNPLRVFFICLFIGAAAIIFDGSLYNYWSLSKTDKELEKRISKMTLATNSLRSQIEQTKSLNFLERQARDRLDLVGPDEMAFVFSDEE